MNKRRFLKFLLGGGCAVSVAAMSGCVPYDPYDPYARYPNYGTYDYYYYPDVNVYFGLYTGYYFYIVDGVWIRSRTLPPHIHLLPRYRQRILVRHPQPYRWNHQHRLRFRSSIGAPPPPTRPAPLRPTPLAPPPTYPRRVAPGPVAPGPVYPRRIGPGPIAPPERPYGTGPAPLRPGPSYRLPPSDRLRRTTPPDRLRHTTPTIPPAVRRERERENTRERKTIEDESTLRRRRGS